jgi:hypothetical protein
MKADIVGAIHEMQRSLSEQLGALRERVKAVEVQLDIRKPGQR